MIFVMMPLILASVQTRVTVLLDSTKESSSGWMLYSSTLQPPTISGWKEVQGKWIYISRTVRTKRNTVYEVCDREISEDVSNWLWTPFIERGKASSITIEIEHYIESCSYYNYSDGHSYDLPFCKTEFAIFLYESESSKSQDELRSWESEDYAELKEIDTFGRNNFYESYYRKFRVNKKGFHLAIRDHASISQK